MEWLTYLLKVSACLGLFYLLYHVFLRKLTFFNFNRIYLLTTLVLSFVTPLLQLQVRSDLPQPGTVVQSMADATGPQMSPVQVPPLVLAAPPVTGAQALNWQDMLSMVYWVIAGIVFIMLLAQIGHLLWHSRRVNAFIGPLRVIHKASGFTNCSFLHYIFVDQADLDAEALAAIMHHESVHAARFHSLDKLLIGICKALLWFSPPIYFYSKAIEQVHEYDADKETSSAIGIAVYANLLLTLAVGKNNAALVHSFVKNPVKDRIKMLFTNQSKNMKKLTYLTLVPAGLALVWLFGVQVMYAEAQSPEALISKDNLRTLTVPPAVPVETPEKKTQLLPVEKAAVLSRPESANADTLRLVNSPVLGKNPVVIIDGKKYSADILTKISPASCKSLVFSPGKAEITTKNNKIEYAVPDEFENARKRNKADSENRFYTRYPVKIDGRDYDEIKVRMNHNFASAAFPAAYKAIMLIDGKSYTEAEAKELPLETGQGKTIVRTTEIKINTELHKKYGDQYQIVIEVLKNLADTIQKTGRIIRRPTGMEVEDGFGKFSYSARDSTVYNEGLKYVTLYGAVKMISEDLEISADKIKFNGTTHIALARNVSFIRKGSREPVKAAFARFDMHQRQL